MVPCERLCLVISSHIEVCGSSSTAHPTMKVFCSSVTVTGCPALWSSDGPFSRLKHSTNLHLNRSETEDLPIMLVKSDWILIASSKSLNQLPSENVKLSLPWLWIFFFFFSSTAMTRCATWHCNFEMILNFDQNLCKGVQQMLSFTLALKTFPHVCLDAWALPCFPLTEWVQQNCPELFHAFSLDYFYGSITHATKRLSHSFLCSEQLCI